MSLTFEKITSTLSFADATGISATIEGGMSATMDSNALFRSEVRMTGSMSATATLNARFEVPATIEGSMLASAEMAGDMQIGSAPQPATMTGSITLDTANDRAELTCDDIVWNSGGSEGSLTARYAYLYDDTGTPATSRIWGYLDQGSAITATNAPYTVDPSATDGFIAIG